MNLTNAKAYLEAYYTEMCAENISIVNFIRFVKPEGDTILDYSCGASIMPSAAIHQNFKHLYYSDSDMGLAFEMLRYKYRVPSFNWNAVNKYLELDSAAFRKKMRRIYLSTMPADLPRKFDTILCFFCLETASHNWREFNAYYKSLLDSINNKGWLIVGLVRDRHGIIPGENEYGCLNITRAMFLKYHTPNIFENIDACEDRGYGGMLFSAERVWTK